MILFAALACGNPGDTDVIPVDELQYFVGTSHFESANGSDGPDAPYVVRRHLDEAAGTIVEDVTTVDDAGDPDAYVVTWVVADDATVTFSDDRGTFSGTGTLTGPDWAWTAWSTTSATTDGSVTIEGTDTLTADGLHAEHAITGADGTFYGTQIDDLPVSDEASWTTARDGI
jgi:hypothetical protein